MMYVLCGVEKECKDHVFFACVYVREVLRLVMHELKAEWMEELQR